MPLPAPTDTTTYLGGGRLYLKEDGATDYIEIGGVQDFSYSTTVETVKALDKTSCTTTTASVRAKSSSGSVSFTTQNIVKENLRLALFGTSSTVNYETGDELPDGTTATEAIAIDKIEALKNPIIEGSIKFVGTTCEGKAPVYDFHRVSLTPNGDISPLAEDFMSIQFSGEMLSKIENGSPKYFDLYLI